MFYMPGIRVNPEEPFEIALKRFRKQVEKGGVISDIRRKEAYEKPSIARKRKEASARKRLMKRLRRVRMRDNRDY
jgi:small subunit ribosomal protein S21